MSFFIANKLKQRGFFLPKKQVNFKKYESLLGRKKKLLLQKFVNLN